MKKTKIVKLVGLILGLIANIAAGVYNANNVNDLDKFLDGTKTINLKKIQIVSYQTTDKYRIIYDLDSVEYKQEIGNELLLNIKSQMDLTGTNLVLVEKRILPMYTDVLNNQQILKVLAIISMIICILLAMYIIGYYIKHKE